MEAIKSLPGYEILQRIAEGDTAVVWLARQLALDRLVAIKVLQPAGVQDPEVRRQFQTEARAAAQINHPGIVQVFDAGEHAGLLYFIMEYVPGCTVADLLKQGKPLSERNALLIAQGCALALEYAWSEAQLIHCDIKPENILIAEDGSVKVTDLGLARFMGMATAVDTIEGTPHYCSPEQARGESILDCRTDIYSLGATLYHLVTGRIPFGANEPLDVLRHQIEDHLQDPMDINTALSSPVAWLIEKMMIKERTLRYASWRAVLSDIERVLDQQFPAGPPPHPGQSTVLRSERRIWPNEPRLAKPQTTESAPTTSAAERKERKRGKIVVSTDFRPGAAHSTDDHEASVDLAREWLYLLAAVIAASVVYGALAVFYLMAPRPSTPVPDAEDDRSATSVSESRPAALGSGGAILRPATAHERRDLLLSPSPPSAMRSPRTAVAESETFRQRASINHTQWSNPTFLRGAHLFNESLAQYETYQRTRAQSSLLTSAEKQCREALAAFESVQDQAPAEAHINELIRQCYQLIADIRQSSLLQRPSASNERLSPIVEPLAPDKMREDDGSYTKTDNLVLAPSWNNPQPGASETKLIDLARLLRPVAQPRVDLTVDTSIVMFGQIFYMMPIREVARIVGKSVGTRRRLTTSGFPQDSFFFYSLSGQYGDDFNTLTLIVDSTDRIAAVQVSRSQSSDEFWLDPTSFSAEWSVYDFVEGKTKSHAKWKIAHRVEKKDRVVRIDTELVSHDSNGYFELGASKSRSSLFLPEPVANLILLRVEELLRNKTSHRGGG